MAENNHITYTSDDEVILALFKCNGNITDTARLLGLKQPKELRERINSKPELKQAKIEALEQLLDKAENKVIKSMTKADAKWILERKGRIRGWGTVVANANLNMDVGEYDLSKYSLEDRMKLLEMISGNSNDTDTK
jgi:hypothetical protein